MIRESWAPPHSLNEGYPYEFIASKALFPNRPLTFINQEGKTQITFDPKHYPGDYSDRDSWIDFLLHRVHDFQEALNLAENQIHDILGKEDPFIPEEFGFACIYKPEKITDSPVRIFESTLDSRFSMHRVMDTLEGQPDNTQWIITKKNDDTFDKLQVSIPCHRIAVALFIALGIKLPEAPKKGIEAIEEATIVEEKPFCEEMKDMSAKQNVGDPVAESAGTDWRPILSGKPKSKMMKPYTVKFNGQMPPDLSNPLDIMAENESDAKTQAKFIIETAPDFGVQVVEFDQLEATLHL